MAMGRLGGERARGTTDPAPAMIPIGSPVPRTGGLAPAPLPSLPSRFARAHPARVMTAEGGRTLRTGPSWWVTGASLGLTLLAALPVLGQGRSTLTPIGGPEMRDGLRIIAGYRLGPVPLDPSGTAIPNGPALHLQVEIDAVEGNPYGFDPEDSVPYLRVPFTLALAATDWRREGVLDPMVSRDGFHYGATVAVPGPGDCVLTIEVRPPQGLARHTDPQTGVGPWWTPFRVTWSFRYPAAP